MGRIVPYVPESLAGCRNSYELVCVMYHALEAHKAYYEAGVLHGHISDRVIMRIPHETRNDITRGILLDLDNSYNWKRHASKPVLSSSASPKSKEELKANVEDSKGEAGQYERNVSASDAMLGRGMKKWLAGQ